MSLRDDINIPVIVVLGITTGLIVAVAIVGTKAGYNYVTQVDLARNYQTAEDRGLLSVAKKVWDPQVKALGDPTGWADAEKRTVHIPLDDAIDRMIESKGKPPVAKPSPEAVQQAAAGATTQPK